MKKSLFLAHSIIATAAVLGHAAEEPLVDKTLVVWVAPSTLDQRGGSALTIDDFSGRFDGVIFAERVPKKWMAGSEHFRRSQDNARQEENADETTAADQFVQMAIVYRGRTVTILRNGRIYTQYDVEEAATYEMPWAAVFGKRHIHASDRATFTGKIDDARIFDRALSNEEIEGLKPNEASAVEPIAWWTFEDGQTADRTGRFTDAILLGGAKVENGCLVTESEGDALVAMPAGLLGDQLVRIATMVSGRLPELEQDEIVAGRSLRRRLIDDPLRPTWHLVIPEGRGMPFDPNGGLFWNGRYHLWYIYQAEAGHHWAHVSGIDLFHWRWHAADLRHNPGDADKGIFSGNCFVAKGGEAVICYHGVGSGGNCVAVSTDKDLNRWTKPESNPVTVPGWDPHAWLEGDTYYQISGGNPPILYRGDSYEKWEKVGNFMSHDMPGVDDFEDVSCPDFFKLGEKWVLICISHPRGCRYYIGDWDGRQFKPDVHRRMNWPGGTYFAPETILDGRGRRILWAWVLDRRSGATSGTMGMPRVLRLADDRRSLRIDPPEEIQRLRYNPKSQAGFRVAAGESIRLDEIRGKIMELQLTIAPGAAQRFGVKVRCSKDGREQTPILVDRQQGILRIDMRKSSLDNPTYREFVMREPNPTVRTLDAPFELKDDEPLELRIFLDRTMLEVFAAGRQCVTQVIYPTLDDALDVQIFAEDAPIEVQKIEAWELSPTMQW